MMTKVQSKQHTLACNTHINPWQYLNIITPKMFQLKLSNKCKLLLVIVTFASLLHDIFKITDNM
jgi:hypothetical protein